MIHRREGAIASPHSRATAAQLGERLRGGDLVDEMEIHVQDGWRGEGLGADDVVVPDFFEKRPGLIHSLAS